MSCRPHAVPMRGPCPSRASLPAETGKLTSVVKGGAHVRGNGTAKTEARGESHRT